MTDFLLEIGLEEVPARMLGAAERELGERVLALLVRERLCEPQAACQTFSTPRRLVVLIPNVAARQPDSEEQMLGPAWSIAFKGDAPMPAAAAFAKKAGIAVEQIRKVTTAKGEYAGATLLRAGQPAAHVLQELLPKEIAALTWPKPMYWRAGKPERFVRPVQWLLALLDSAIVPLEFAGIHAGNVSFGHRVLHGTAPVPIASPYAYLPALRAAHVEPEVEQRRHIIRKALDHATRAIPAARWREDSALVDTVTHLTEWPTVLLGSFAPSFLALPEEVLVTVMRDHQKYFALEETSGKLLPHFLAVLNTQPAAAGEAVIRHGNERVLRARFNDAQFFWDFDNRIPFAQRGDMLSAVTFHKDLGSYRQKTDRNLAVAQRLQDIAAQRGVAINARALERAVALAKADLTTELVKEFTELQGIVGGLYLRRVADPGDPDAEAAAQAIYWQYMPASITDPIPPTVEGQLLGLADRIATITDLFASGLAPTGSRDPYALRRGANAIIKILAAASTRLLLPELVHAASADAKVAEEVANFLRERLSFYLREVCGLPADVVSAVLAADSANVPDALSRAEALAQVRASEDFAAIAAAWKRTKNILRQAEEKGIARGRAVDQALFTDDAERELWASFAALTPQIERLRAQGAYPSALQQIARLRPQVDRFFDTVMVMAEDASVRANRLALLAAIIEELGRIADFSEIVPVSVTE